MADAAIRLQRLSQFENIAAAGRRGAGRGRRAAGLIVGDNPANRREDLLHRRIGGGFWDGHFKTQSWEIAGKKREKSPHFPPGAPPPLAPPPKPKTLPF